MTTFQATGLLFDNDGVLTDSDAEVEEAWTVWARHWDLDPDEVLPVVHGTPSRLTVARFIAEPHREKAAQMVDQLELDTADGAQAIPGAVALLESLRPGTWAIVTSGNARLAGARMRAAGIPVPTVLITSDDVAHGKPDPEPYLTAATRLDVPPSACVVFEDSGAGVQAARAAGVGHVVGVARENPGIDVFVPDLRSVSVDGDAVTIAS